MCLNADASGCMMNTTNLAWPTFGCVSGTLRLVPWAVCSARSSVDGGHKVGSNVRNIANWHFIRFLCHSDGLPCPQLIDWCRLFILNNGCRYCSQLLDESKNCKFCVVKRDATWQQANLSLFLLFTLEASSVFEVKIDRNHFESQSGFFVLLF